MTDQQTQTSSSAAPPAAAPAGTWYPEAYKDVVATKGFKDVGDVLNWGVNAEKLIGHHTAGRTVVLPKDANDVEGIKAFRTKLGVPETADGYGIKPPEGQDGQFLKTAAGWFQKHGLTKEQGTALAGDWNAFWAQEEKNMDAQALAASEEEITKLKGEWGQQFAEKSAAAQDAAARLGWTPEEVKKIEAAVGTRALIERFAAMGAMIGEAKFAGNPPNTGGGNSGVTKQAAQQAYVELNAKRINGQITAEQYQAEASRLGPLAFG